MGHVPVENETITFVATLRHNEMMAARMCEATVAETPAQIHTLESNYLNVTSALRAG
jgi:hypothetical protein